MVAWNISHAPCQSCGRRRGERAVGQSESGNRGLRLAGGRIARGARRLAPSDWLLPCPGPAPPLRTPLKVSVSARERHTPARPERRLEPRSARRGERPAPLPSRPPVPSAARRRLSAPSLRRPCLPARRDDTGAATWPLSAPPAGPAAARGRGGAGGGRGEAVPLVVPGRGGRGPPSEGEGCRRGGARRRAGWGRPPKKRCGVRGGPRDGPPRVPRPWRGEGAPGRAGRGPEPPGLAGDAPGRGGTPARLVCEGLFGPRPGRGSTAPCVCRAGREPAGGSRRAGPSRGLLASPCPGCHPSSRRC